MQCPHFLEVFAKNHYWLLMVFDKRQRGAHLGASHLMHFAFVIEHIPATHLLQLPQLCDF